jgi:hypothetical protein
VVPEVAGSRPVFLPKFFKVDFHRPFFMAFSF